MSPSAALPTRRVVGCLACGAQRVRPLAMRYEHRGAFPAAECAVCGMRFLAVQPTADGLADLYGASYFEKDYRCGRSEHAYADEAAFRSENQGLLDAFQSLVSPGRLLEVGCAGGWLLKHAKERGWEARGVELSSSAARSARALGLEVHEGTLESAGLQAASFDLVYMGDVLEHVPDCRSTLTEVVRVLKPGGWFYLRGPITTNSLARRLALAASRAAGKTIVLREPPYHLWEFTPRALRRLCRTAGLEVVRLDESKIPPGRTHGRKSVAARLAMALIDAVNLPITRMFNAFGDRVVLIARRPPRP